jgi:hypothetical protein
MDVWGDGRVLVPLRQALGLGMIESLGKDVLTYAK